MLMCHQGHFYVWSLGRGPEKHKQLVEQLRKVVCVKPGVPDLPVKVADRPHHSQVGYCKSLPRRLLEHLFPSGYTITLSGWWYTYPSEKYESIGRIIPIYYGKIIQMFQTTSQIMYIYSYYCIYPSILLKDFHGFCDP